MRTNRGERRFNTDKVVKRRLKEVKQFQNSNKKLISEPRRSAKHSPWACRKSNCGICMTGKFKTDDPYKTGKAPKAEPDDFDDGYTEQDA